MPRRVCLQALAGRCSVRRLALVAEVRPQPSGRLRVPIPESRATLKLVGLSMNSCISVNAARRKLPGLPSCSFLLQLQQGRKVINPKHCQRIGNCFFAPTAVSSF